MRSTVTISGSDYPREIARKIKGIRLEMHINSASWRDARLSRVEKVSKTLGFFARSVQRSVDSYLGVDR